LESQSGMHVDWSGLSEEEVELFLGKARHSDGGKNHLKMSCWWRICR